MNGLDEEALVCYEGVLLGLCLTSARRTTFFELDSWNYS